MKQLKQMILSLVFCCLFVAAASATDSDMQEAKFVIDEMDCAACPIIVRKAMHRVKGVRTVSVDFDSKIAVVTFDESLTNPEEIGAASDKMGYPATIVENNTN